jgi:hypothetical protein
MNYSRWEPNPPDERDPMPGYPDPTMPPPEPQRDPSPDPNGGRRALYSSRSNGFPSGPTCTSDFCPSVMTLAS